MAKSSSKAASGAKPLKIRQKYFYAKSPARLFRALTDPDELTRWFLKRATITLEEGSEYEFAWYGGFAHRGRVVRVEQNRRLTLTWPNTVGRAVNESVVTFTIGKVKGGSTLTVEHAGFPFEPRWIEVYGGTQAGWAYFLVNLRSVLEHKRDLRSRKDG
jgi:uncharacterized protein YndB with AHSA1/START domain